MNYKLLVHAICVAVIGCCISGCDTQPEDIQKWQAEGNSEKLVKVLSDSRQFMRIEAIDALAELKAESAVDPLGTLIKDPDVVIVHKSLEALATIGTPSIEKYMLQAITFETNPARLIATKTLGQLKSAAAVDPLIKTLNDKYENVAVNAAVSLGQIGDAKAIPALAGSSKQGSVRLRGSSTASIRQIGGEAAIEPLFSLLSDESTKVHNEAVAGLIEAGPDAAPLAIKALRSNNGYERQSALAILEGINNVPTAGSDLVWYQLADLAVGENPKIQRAKGREIAQIPDCTGALIEALSHSEYAIREHAFLALETIGESAAAATLAAASGVKPEAEKWLNERSSWAGAPAWQLDLWGAATALNPSFELDKRNARLLADSGTSTTDMLGSKNYQPQREEIPLLIGQMATSGSEDEKLVKNADLRRKLAFRKLRAYKQRSKFPLLAAVNDDDFQIAALAAEILVSIDDDARTTQTVVDSFSTRVESGEELHDTPFYDAMTELDMPEVDGLILKVRPNGSGAIYAFNKKYPDVQVSNMVMPPGEQHPTAEPFRLKYLKDGKAKEMKVIFRPDDDGNWVPEPPFPDELP